MQNRYTLGKVARLCHKRDIENLFQGGKSLLSYPIRSVYRVADVREDFMPDIQMMVSVGKRFHKRAVKRNLLKRRIREAYRLNRPCIDLGDGLRLHIAFTYISKEVEDYATIEHAIKKSIANIIAAVNHSG